MKWDEQRDLLLAKATGTPVYVMNKGRVVDLNAGNGKQRRKTA